MRATKRLAEAGAVTLLACVVTGAAAADLGALGSVCNTVLWTAVWVAVAVCVAVAPAHATESARAPVGTVRIDVSEAAGAQVEAVRRILARQIQDRCAARVVDGSAEALTAELSVELIVDAESEPAEGYAIADAESGAVRITGGDRLGLLYGAGKFLRTSRYNQGGFAPGPWRGSSSPDCPVRAIYFATHYWNYYEAAPLDDVVRYVEDLCLWGYNTLVVHFPTWQFDGLTDGAAKAWLVRFGEVMRAARSCGMRVALVQVPNQGYRSAPASIRGAEVPGNFRGNFGVNVCPSVPEGQRYLLGIYDELLAEFRSIGLDYLILWPYDEGGCGCSACWPWGARGYLSLSRELAGRVRTVFPSCRVVLSTWGFENEDDANPDGEWDGLAVALAQDRSRLDYILADGHQDYFPAYILSSGTPGGLPLLNFPEISMFGWAPWGGFGANPAPAHFDLLWSRVKRTADGGLPYSEGIYEDINKAIWAQFYWDRERAAEDVVKEYAAFEFSPDAAEDVLGAVRILETNHDRNRIGENAVRAWELITRAQAALTPQASAGWRWRILFLRALIDKEIHQRDGRLEGETLGSAFAELSRIYHVRAETSANLTPPEAKATSSP